ncbi:MAG: hypothetical protein AMJ54_12410 [Deltaproteobacteria bacterium SG8_13]|nr:MAG: hypothetical protein AMJ54_12410 [Deltaproteobacteria bacterium SG8_13]
MKPNFKPGKNIAIKVPLHRYRQTVSFYRDTLGLEPIDRSSPGSGDSVGFKFGDKNLWIDRSTTLSQAEIWLEIETEDIAQAAAFLEKSSIARRDQIEPLPDGFNGFWITSPADIIHLVTGEK